MSLQLFFDVDLLLGVTFDAVESFENGDLVSLTAELSLTGRCYFPGVVVANPLRLPIRLIE